MHANIIHHLNRRRRRLRIPYRAIAKRSGVSPLTVQRVLKGESSGTFETVAAIAKALGVSLRFVDDITVHELRRQEARAKAQRLVRMVQASSQLEGQGVDDEAMEDMVAQTTAELLASNVRLWGS